MCNQYAIDFNVDIPITSSDFGDFGKIVPNKRTALYRNLSAFNGVQQFIIIKEICEHQNISNNPEVIKLKELLFERYPQFSEGCVWNSENTKTLSGWERVDRTLSEMQESLQIAKTEEQYQTIGMLGRENLITVAQQVFIKEIHKLADDETDIGNSDSKRMLCAYLEYELKNDSDKAKKFVKAAVDLCNHLTHDRTATKRKAYLCVAAVKSVVNIISAIKETE